MERSTAIINTSMNETEKDQINLEDLENKIKAWNKSMIEDFNNTSGSMTDTKVLAAVLRGSVKDMQEVMIWIELIVSRLRKLEQKNHG